MSLFTFLKGEYVNFFIGLFDVPKYYKIWTKNGDVVDSYILEMLMFKECSKRVQHVLDTL